MTTNTPTTTCTSVQAAQIEELKSLLLDLACHAPDNLTWDEANLVDDIVALLGLGA